jgi:hypothetical protein
MPKVDRREREMADLGDQAYAPDDNTKAFQFSAEFRLGAKFCQLYRPYLPTGKGVHAMTINLRSQSYVIDHQQRHDCDHVFVRTLVRSLVQPSNKTIFWTLTYFEWLGGTGRWVP